MVRYVRDEELIADALKQTRRGVRDVQRPTGTERAQTMDTAIQAAADSTFARDLAEQLEVTVGEAQDVLDTKIPELESAQADLESGLTAADGRIDTAQGRADAAFGKAESADGKAVAAQSVAADALAQAGVSDVFIQDTAPRANLAPAIKGDGTWAEVYRNVLVNPTFDTGISNWISGLGGVLSWDATGGRSGSGAIKVATPGAAANEGVYSNLRVPTGAADGVKVSASARVKAPAGASMHLMVNIIGGTPRVTQFTGTGDWQQVKAENAIIGATNTNPYVLVRTSAPHAITFHVDEVVMNLGERVFDFYSLANDPDFRLRFLGTPSASESVLEIERAGGIAANVGVVAGISTQDGMPAIRQIPIGSSFTSYSTIPIPSIISDAGTFLATNHQNGPIEGTIWAYQGRPYVISPEQPSSVRLPNEAGSLSHRKHFVGLGTTRLLILPHGGIRGSGDVRWTGIGLYPGAYDGPNLNMENILWVDTAGGNNTPKRWNGTTWAAVTDKTATDAAAAAVAAQTKANQAFDNAGTAIDAAATAQSAADQAAADATTKSAAAEVAAKAYADAEAEAARLAAIAVASDDATDKANAAKAAAELAAAADASTKADAAEAAAKADAAAALGRANDAHTLAGTAEDNAQAALTMAGSKARVTYSTTAPTGTASVNDIHRRQPTAAETSAGASAGDIMQEWRYASGGWQEVKVSSTAISNLDVGKLTVGTGVISDLVAEHIAARSGQFIELDVRQLNVTDMALLKEVVAEAFWSKVVTTGVLYAIERIITPELIALESITTELLNATAIDGMTVTGALIRTAPTGQRMQFDIDGLKAFNASNQETARIEADTGGISVGLPDGAKAFMVSSPDISSVGTSREVAGVSARSQVNAYQFGTLHRSGFDAEAAILGSTSGISLFAEVDTSDGVKKAVLSTTDFLEIYGPSVVLADGQPIMADEYLNQWGGISAPYAMAAGTDVARAVVAGGALQTTVTFPVGRFTQPPNVQCTPSDNLVGTGVAASTVTASSFSIGRNNSSAVSRTFGVRWQAVQMLTNNANG